MSSSLSKVLGGVDEGQLFVLSAPAGTGKTTLTERLIAEFPCVVQSLSTTTRAKREGEEEDLHYHFVTKERFLEKIQQGDFLEHAEIYGEYYGTSKSWVEQHKKKGKHVVMVIDTQGAMQLMENGCEATYIFIAPPSIEALEQRLRGRGTETEASIQRRIDWAKHELRQAEHYDYLLVNDDLEVAYVVLKSIFIAEEHKRK